MPAGGVDPGRQIAVAFVDQHLFDARQVVGQLLQHALQHPFLLERLHLSGIQLLVGERTGQQRGEQLEPAPEAGLPPGAAQRDLDVPVAQHERHVGRTRGIDRSHHLRSRLHAEVKTQPSLKRVQHDVGEHQEALAFLQHTADIELHPAPLLA